MSTAERFTFMGRFPFCPEPVPGGLSYVGGLSLADVMAFWWNLETFTLTLTGTLSITTNGPAGGVPVGTTYEASANGTVVASPSEVTGDFSSATAYVATTGSLFGSSGLGVSSRAPRERVCASAAPAASLTFSDDASGSSAGQYFAGVRFGVYVDPVDATKFAIEYHLLIQAMSPTAHLASCGIFFSDTDPGSQVINTGTFTIAGINFPYWCYWYFTYPSVADVSTTGGTLSASSSGFSY